MVEEGSTAAFRVCFDQRDGLEEPGVSADYGEHIFMAPRLWKWTQDVKIYMGKSFVRNSDVRHGHFNSFPCLNSSALVAAF